MIAPKGWRVRPTPERVREAVFDILGDWISGVRCLDVFAGSGAIAAEALSRGAKAVLLLEENREALDVLANNLEAAGFHQSRWEVLPGDALRSLEVLVEGDDRFDFIYLDPPYASGAGAKAVESAARLIKPSGWVALEHLFKSEVLEVTDLERIETRRFGDTSVTFFRPGGS